MPRVNPEILRWARESAGLELEEAAHKVQLHDAYGLRGAERLSALEAGDEEPSRAMLVRMAKQYRRPLLTFYLSAPPRKGNRGQDFRTLPEDHSEDDEAILDALLRDIHARHRLIKAAIEDEDEPEPLTFVGSVSIEDGVEILVTRFRDTLQLDLQELREQPTVEEAFRLLRERIEALGVFVILASNLGSHHTTIPPQIFRGLAVADDVAPLIVVNDQDSRSAWLFTLLHEFAHIWLGLTGISGEDLGRRVEKFCNDVASEFLVPNEELALVTAELVGTQENLLKSIGTFADSWKVSRALIAYRLYRSRRINQAQWQSLTTTFRRQWLEQRERKRAATREASGGPDYYVVKRHRLGNKLLRTTARLLASGILTTIKASQILGVKPNNVQTLTAGISLASGRR